MLNVRIGVACHHVETSPEMSRLIDLVIRGQSVSIPGVGIGDPVSFSFTTQPYTMQSKGWWPDNYLRVGVNAKAGYGGLVWYVSPRRAEIVGDEKSRQCWVSDNPTPPEFDPQVLSDPGSPICYDRRSVLPVARVREALQEFCNRGTGDRPECIDWVPSEINGERLVLQS